MQRGEGHAPKSSITEAEAIKLVAADPMKYLDSETVTRTEYKKPQQKSGWGNALKDQLLGTNSKR